MNYSNINKLICDISKDGAHKIIEHTFFFAQYS